MLRRRRWRRFAISGQHLGEEARRFITAVKRFLAQYFLASDDALRYVGLNGAVRLFVVGDRSGDSYGASVIGAPEFEDEFGLLNPSLN